MVRDSYALHCINKNIDLKNRTHINLFTVDLDKISKLSTKKDNKKTEKVEKKSVVTIKKVSNRSTKKSSISNNDLMLLRESLNLISDDNRFIEFIKDCKDINENDPYHVVRSKYHTISRKYKISDVEKYRNIYNLILKMMYKIETNCDSNNPIHDIFKYKPIEVQVYEILCNLFDCEIDAKRIDKNLSWFTIKNIILELEVKKSAKLILLPNNYDKNLQIVEGWDSVHFNNYDYNMITCSLFYNRDLDKLLQSFKTKIDLHFNMLDDLKNLISSVNFDFNAISQFIKNSLNTSKLEAKNTDKYIDYNGNPFMFNIAPYKNTPADGIYLKIEDDFKLNINSNFNEQSYKDAFRRIKYENDILGLEEQTRDLKELMININNFDVNKCPELISYLNFLKHIRDLYEKYNFKKNTK